MSLLSRSQLRFVYHAPWSAATALLGVALGVASVVAVHLISAEVVKSLEGRAPPHLTGLTHVLERPGLDAPAYFALRARWRRSPGGPVAGLVPLVEGHLTLNERQVLVLGVDWLAMPTLPTGRKSAGSTASGPSESGFVSTDMLIGQAVLADSALGFGAGDRVQVGDRYYRIADVRDTGLGAALVADIAAAQHMLRTGPGTVHRVGLALDDPWRPWRERLDRLMPGFAAGLPRPRSSSLHELAPDLAAVAGHRAADGNAAGGDGGGWLARPVAAERPEAEFARAVLFNLGALGTLALLVAWFLIYQVGVIWLRRQHLLLTRLHAVGVAHRALRRSFLTAFLVMGCLATALGLVVGVLLADLLAEVTAQGLEEAGSVTLSERVLDPWLLVKALVSGLGICLLGGLGAFAREWRERDWSAGWRFAAPGLAAVVAAGILVESSGVLGGFLAIFAMSLLGVALVTPALWLLRRGVVDMGGPLLIRLALRDVAWYPRMLGVALAALSLAVAASIGIGLMVESFRLDFDRMLDVRLAGDLYLEAAPADVEALRRWLEDQPETGAYSAYGRQRARVGGVPVELGYSRFDAAESARYRYPRALSAGEALVSERLARDLNAAPGDVLRVAEGALTVVGTFPGFGDPLGRVLVDVSTLDRLQVDPVFDRITLALAPGAGTGQDLAQRLTERFPQVEVERRTELRAAVLRIFDRTFAITRALTLVALVVAVVGTYNALTALRLHQAPTTTLLQAQGVTAAQVRRIALVRAGTVGGIAMALALPLGLAMAWTLCAVINPRSFGWTVDLHLPVSGWLAPLLLGAVAALVAGALPAPRERGALHEEA